MAPMTMIHALGLTHWNKAPSTNDSGRPRAGVGAGAAAVSSPSLRGAGRAVAMRQASHSM